MKNHKQLRVSKDFTINNFKDYVTERKKTAVSVLESASISGESIHHPPLTGGHVRASFSIGQERSVDIKGNYAVVGEPSYEPSGGTTGNQGRAHVFKKSGDTWSQIATLLPADPEDGDKFGTACAISVNGTYVVVGAPYEDDAAGSSGAGRIYIFKNNGSDSYTELAQDIISPNPGVNNYFGHDLAMDGDHIIVGEPYAVTVSLHRDKGKAYIFKKNSGSDTWALEATLTGDQATDQSGGLTDDDRFGSSVDITSHGDRKYVIVAGSDDSDTPSGAIDAPNSGAAWIYELPSGGSWTFKSKLKASDAKENDSMGDQDPGLDSFGGIAIHGGVAAVGVCRRDDFEGAVYVFERDASTGLWGVESSLYPSPPHSTPTRTENVILADHSVEFDLEDDDYFGYSIAIGDGVIVVSAPVGNITARDKAGNIYVFTKIGGSWVYQPSLKTSGTPPAGGTAIDSQFGSSVAISGTNLVVSAPRQDVPVPGQAWEGRGATYFYNINISISNPSPGDENPVRSPRFQPPFSSLMPGIHSLRRK